MITITDNKPGKKKPRGMASVWERIIKRYRDIEDVHDIVVYLSDEGLDRLRWYSRGTWRHKIDQEIKHRKDLKKVTEELK